MTELKITISDDLEKKIKENPDSYSLYLDYKKLTNSIFDYFGIWSDLSDEQFNIITESINDIRKNIMKRYYSD